ncbi:hypothetical protein F2Q70_00031517 [Brassica cretica]|uniref:Uncharacterized protein n=1 Tax=Brassica cretica TaxID=69181 RepID=A0A8S9FQ70_BRACR|nr:hypothetical protein F2Q70_00031517 [Brassica cretica]
MWMSLDGQLWEDPIYGDTKYHSTRISFAFGSRSTAMGDGEYASAFDMPELWDRLQGADRHDQGASRLAKLCNGIGEDRYSADMLPGLQDHLCSTCSKPYF